jgi:hypothetical protein
MPPQVQLSCQIPEAWLEAIAQYAEVEGISQSEVLKVAIAQLLDLSDPHDWSGHFARLEQQITKLSKQVMVLHRRLQTVEAEQNSPPLLQPAASNPPLPTARSLPAINPAAELIDMLEGELVSQETEAQTAAVTDSSTPRPLSERLIEPRKRFGAVRLEELCRLNRINPLAIETKARSVGLSLPEAIELETGWKYDPQTKTYAPPL